MQKEPDGIRRLIHKPYKHRGPCDCLPDDMARRVCLAISKPGCETAAGVCQTLILLPDAPLEVWYWLGLARRTQGLYEQAEAAAVDALARNPGYAEAWWLRGMICFDELNFDEAISHLGHAIALIPTYRNAWKELYRAHALAGHSDAALAALLRALELNPNHRFLQQRLRERLNRPPGMDKSPPA